VCERVPPMPGATAVPPPDTASRGGGPPSRLIVSAALLVAAAVCGPRGRPASKVGTASPFSPPAPAFEIAADTVTWKGSWSPVVEPEAHVPNMVKTTCLRATRRCREEITTALDGASPFTESFDYRVEEWTKAKIVAARKDCPAEVQIRVALTGLTAAKTRTIRKGKNVVEVRWRLE